jgi:hypothetical protein
MSTTVTLIIFGIAAYVVLVAFVLALLTVARRADEAAKAAVEAEVRRPRVPAPRMGRFTSREGEVGDRETTAGDAETRRRARSPSGTGGRAR